MNAKQLGDEPAHMSEIPAKITKAMGRVAYATMEELLAAHERIAELEKDAARYRWMKERDMREVYSNYWDDGDALTPALDAAIDEAMKDKT